MKAFSNQMHKFSKHHRSRSGGCQSSDSPTRGIVEAREHGISKRAVFQPYLLLCLAFAHAHQNWDFARMDVD